MPLKKEIIDRRIPPLVIRLQNLQFDLIWWTKIILIFCFIAKFRLNLHLEKKKKKKKEKEETNRITNIEFQVFHLKNSLLCIIIAIFLYSWNLVKVDIRIKSSKNFPFYRFPQAMSNTFASIYLSIYLSVSGYLSISLFQSIYLYNY